MGNRILKFVKVTEVLFTVTAETLVVLHPYTCFLAFLPCTHTVSLNLSLSVMCLSDVCVCVYLSPPLTI